MRKGIWGPGEEARPCSPNQKSRGNTRAGSGSSQELAASCISPQLLPTHRGWAGPVSRSSPRSAEAPVCSILFSTWSFQDGRLQVQDRAGSMHVRKFRKTEKIDREQKGPGQEEQEWKGRQNGSSILCNVQPVSLVKHTLRQRLPDATNINSPLFLNSQTATLFRPLL